MRLKTSKNYSPNFSLPKRSHSKVKFVIIHYTGMKKESLAIKRLCNPVTKVSSHYFLKKNGSILELVPDLYEAWHAGKSSWKKYSSLNKYSIGIEIQNSGHNNSYESFSSKQIISLKNLLKYLVKTYKIDKKNILGHSDIAPNRKKDPGEKFPWKDLSKIKLCKWHNLDEKKLKKTRLIKLTMNEQEEFLKNLLKIGYKKLPSSNFKNEKKLLFKAFQRRYRQSLINGLPDQECLLISKNLLKS
ncbi:N-acetylmuramoyl-L-alanine amidase [Candidatus Pelagibacter sp.]|nr:N-acetylmuramoyl-L-alanine amidase [Candidatus Pelagibacter sp.]